MVLVAARPDVPEPPVPPRRAVGRARSTTPVPSEAGHVQHEDDLGQPRRARDRAVGATTTPTCRSRRCGASGSTTITHSLDRYFEDARSRAKLANVVTWSGPAIPVRAARRRPSGRRRPRRATRGCASVFQAFAQSPQGRGRVRRVLYDEWGGCFDHVKPPASRRAPAGRLDGGCAQLGFEPPAISRRRSRASGFADHTVYDHTSVAAAARVALPRRAGDGHQRTASEGGGGSPSATATPPTSAPRSRPSRRSTSASTSRMDLPAPADPCTFGAKGGRDRQTATRSSPSQAMADLQDSRFKDASDTPWSQRGLTVELDELGRAVRRGSCPRPRSARRRARGCGRRSRPASA